MKSKSIFLILVVMLIPLVMGATEFFVDKDVVYDIKVSCDKDGGLCTATAECNLTINYPNSTILLDNQRMDNLNNGYFNYTLNENQTTPSGEYRTRVSCLDGGLNDTANFIYEVNPTGIRPSDQKTESLTRSIYFIFGIGILCFIGFLFIKPVPVKWTFFLVAILLFVVALNTLFIGLQDEVVNPKLETFFSGALTIAFILYWFIGFLIFFLWMVTFIMTIMDRMEVKKMRRLDQE